MKVKTIVLGLFGALALAGCNGTVTASAASNLKTITLTQTNYTDYVQVSEEEFNYNDRYYSLVFSGSPNLRYDNVLFELVSTSDATNSYEIKLTVFGSGRLDRIHSTSFNITLKRGSVTEIVSWALA
jgi:hypothetical protein